MEHLASGPRYMAIAFYPPRAPSKKDLKHIGFPGFTLNCRKMVQRHNSISGRRSLSGAGGGASAAAAAAAATAATATAYTHISSKLEGIEGLISALKVRLVCSTTGGKPLGIDS